jgi:hypothetical protein
MGDLDTNGVSVAHPAKRNVNPINNQTAFISFMMTLLIKGTLLVHTFYP